MRYNPGDHIAFRVGPMAAFKPMKKATDTAPIPLPATAWGDFPDVHVTPVVVDEIAGQALEKVHRV